MATIRSYFFAQCRVTKGVLQHYLLAAHKSKLVRGVKGSFFVHINKNANPTKRARKYELK